MFKFIIPTILVVIAIGIFVIFANPIYSEVRTLRVEAAAYKEALGNSKALENERDKLTQKYNSIPTADLQKLRTMLPDSVDNIRLILEIEKIAMTYGMPLKDVKYETQEKNNQGEGATPAPQGVPDQAGRSYGVWQLEFSVTGSYGNFLNFTRDLEKNLRIVDIVSIDFSSSLGAGVPFVDFSKYNFVVNTYWLKN